MRKVIPSLAGLALLVAAASAGADPCRFSAPRNADLDAAALKSLLLNLGSTDVHIQGEAGLSRIEVRGIACASNPKWLDDLRIDTSRSGPQATVTVRTRDHDNTFGLLGIQRYAYIRLSVSVPDTLAVTIHSGSGDVVAASLASLDLYSSSGDLQASKIEGALTLDLGSGDVYAYGIGSVQLHSSGSGDVKVSGVDGDVHAGHVGSGDIDFSDVRGSVSLGSIGSGDLRLQNIGGNVQVSSVGSGDLVARHVAGNLQVDAKGSGDVSYHDIKGTVHVPSSDDDD